MNFKYIQTETVEITNNSNEKFDEKDAFNETYSPIVFYANYFSLLRVSIHKILIDYKIRNNEEKIIKKDIKAIINNDKLSYKDDNESIKLNINKENIIMIKENIDSKLTFNFIKNKTTELEYYIKLLNSYLDGSIKTNEIIIKNNYIYIEYELFIQDEYMGNFKYEINIKEMK